MRSVPKKPPTTLRGIDSTVFFSKNCFRSNLYPKCWRAGHLEGALRRGQVAHHPADGDGADSEGVEDAAEPHPLLEGRGDCTGQGLDHASAAGV